MTDSEILLMADHTISDSVCLRVTNNDELLMFARAIEQRTVKECIQQADNEASRFYDMDAPDYGLMMLNFCQLLKEHFGVSDD